MNLRKSIPWWRPAALLLVIVLAAVIITAKNHGYRWTLAPDQEASDSPSRVLRVSPSELFTGDLNRLEPHLNFASSGCVKFETPNQMQDIGFETEVWEQGKARTLNEYTPHAQKPDSASFSLREITDAKGQRKFHYVEAVSAKGSSVSVTTERDMPECYSNSVHYTKKLSEPRELNEGDKLAVWAFVIPMHKADSSFTHFESIEEAAKAAQWAFVVKVYWECTKY